MENNQQEKKSVSLFDNPISLSIIIGSFIVGLCVLIGAYMIKGSSTPSAVALNPGTQTAGAPTNVKVSDRSDEPMIGDANAPVTIYEFGDFQCPYCKQFYQQTFADIKSKYIDTGKVKLVFRHFPLTQIHVNAEISSEAAECANRQGKFEAYYNSLYTNGQADGTGLDEASLKTYAQQDGLNMTTFDSCLDGHQTQATVQADEALGMQIGVSGTPSFVVNGNVIVGAQPSATFEQAIEAALKKS